MGIDYLPDCSVCNVEIMQVIVNKKNWIRKIFHLKSKTIKIPLEETVDYAVDRKTGAVYYYDHLKSKYENYFEIEYGTLSDFF
jgi:hypothetical protein